MSSWNLALKDHFKKFCITCLKMNILQKKTWSYSVFLFVLGLWHNQESTSTIYGDPIPRAYSYVWVMFCVMFRSASGASKWFWVTAFTRNQGCYHLLYTLGENCVKCQGRSPGTIVPTIPLFALFIFLEVYLWNWEYIIPVSPIFPGRRFGFLGLFRFDPWIRVFSFLTTLSLPEVESDITLLINNKLVSCRHSPIIERFIYQTPN